MPRIISKNWLYLLLTFFIAFSITLVSARMIHVFLADHNNQAAETDNSQTNEGDSNSENLDKNAEPSTPISAFINLQPVVDEWVKAINGKTGIMIYDLDQSRVAAEYNANESFFAASIYKLFFAYDGYLQIEAGNEKSDEFFIYDREKGNLTYGACLDLMIRESYSPCADPMRSDPVKYQRIEQYANQLELTNTSDVGLYTSAADLIELLKIIYRHDGLSETNWQKLLDSMLNQPTTTYNWRQGLPSGFTVATVYDKVGWNSDDANWTTYNDAAIIKFVEQNRNYAIVVLTADINPEELVRLGKSLETAILQN